MNNTKRRGTRELALCGMLAAMAMVFSYIESLLPIPYPFPGMRLGFANIAIISALYLYGARDAFIINIIRIHIKIQTLFFIKNIHTKMPVAY